MHHFEAFTAAKDPARPETNEDQMVLRPGLVLAVIDGATDISGERFDDPLGTAATGGRLAARAMAQALSGWAAGETDAPPDPLPALEATNAGLLSLYHRIGRLDAAASNGELRFRATFAGAFFSRDCIRLVRLGDSGFRVNGRPVLEKHYPGDTVLSAARSAGWQRLSASGLDADSIRPLAHAPVSAPVTWDELPDVDPRDLTVRTMPARFAELGDLHAEIDDVAHDLTPLLELYAAQESSGLGDMPYPPEYPKMPGEPARVQPSRARKPN